MEYFSELFKPSLKLKKKIRLNSRFVKIYHPPKTPYQRVLESSFVSQNTKDELTKLYNSIDPFKLMKQINKKKHLILSRRSVT